MSSVIGQLVGIFGKAITTINAMTEPALLALAQAHDVHVRRNASTDEIRQSLHDEVRRAFKLTVKKTRQAAQPPEQKPHPKAAKLIDIVNRIKQLPPNLRSAALARLAARLQAGTKRVTEVAVKPKKALKLAPLRLLQLAAAAKLAMAKLQPSRPTVGVRRPEGAVIADDKVYIPQPTRELAIGDGETIHVLQGFPPFRPTTAEQRKDHPLANFDLIYDLEWTD